MKPVYFLKPFIFALFMIATTGCNDSSIEEIESLELKTVLEKRGEDERYETMLIQYRRGLAEIEKQRIRDYYIKIGFLISWESCGELFMDFETWTVLPRKDSDLLLEPEEDDDDIERSIPRESCRSL